MKLSLGGVLLVFFGLIFLLSNFGILGNGFWNSVGKLWPIILILVGVGILFPRSKLP